MYGPVSYTHLDVYKRQVQSEAIIHILIQCVCVHVCVSLIIYTVELHLSEHQLSESPIIRIDIRKLKQLQF